MAPLHQWKVLVYTAVPSLRRRVFEDCLVKTYIVHSTNEISKEKLYIVSYRHYYTNI